MSKNNNSSKNNAESNYYKRNIIKLGSSFAITYPKDFLRSFAPVPDVEDDEELEKLLKQTNVHCYKVDDTSILIKKNKAENEIKSLTIDVSDNKAAKFPIDLLENLLICARKLNLNQVNVYYAEKDYEKCLEIMNRLGNPIFSENMMTLDLSRTYQEYNFSDQINGMIKNFSKIIEIIIDDSDKTNDQLERSINTFLQAIKSSFNEALRVLIIRLNNYFLEQGDDSNIINTLGNRVLVSLIKSSSFSASALFVYRDSKELKKYISIISQLPEKFKQEINLILSPKVDRNIEKINEFSTDLDKLKKEFQDLDAKKDHNSAYEATITSIINIIITSISDILEIIITRWIENSLEIQ